MEDNESSAPQEIRRLVRRLRWGYARPVLMGAVAVALLIVAMAASALLHTDAGGIVEVAAVVTTFGGGGASGWIATTLLMHRARAGRPSGFAGDLRHLIAAIVIAAVAVTPVFLGTTGVTPTVSFAMPLLPFAAVIAMVAVNMAFRGGIDALSARRGRGDRDPSTTTRSRDR